MRATDESELGCQRELFDIPSDLVYLNCATMGPQLRAATDAGFAAVRAGAAPWMRTSVDWFTDAERLRGLAARIIGCDSDSVALVPSVSYGIAIAAANVKLERGQSIVVLDQQFPSNVYAWRELARERGGQVTTVRRGAGEGWTEPLLASIGPNTAVVAVPNCHWSDGGRIDLPRVAAAARAVGAPRSTLDRWEKAPEPRSRRPKRIRRPKWPLALIEAVEAVRADNPMGGKRKIAAILNREGQAVSVSKVGRILRRRMDRGAVVPAPILRRRPGGRCFRFDTRQRYAKRLAKGRKARAPGDLVQIDTLFVNVRPDQAIKRFTAYDPVAKWTIGHVASAASAIAARNLLDKLLAGATSNEPNLRRIGGVS